MGACAFLCVASQAHAAQQTQELAYHLSPEKLQAAKQLASTRLLLTVAGTLWSLLVLWQILARGWAARLSLWCSAQIKRKWLQGLVYFALVLLLLTVLDWPLAAMGHGVSLHYGISVQGWSGWLWDEVKTLLLSVAVAAPAMLLLHWIVRKSPRRYWLWGWLVTLPMLLLGTFVVPLLVPLFYAQEPLAAHHAELVRKLETVVDRTGLQIPPERMYLMKASAKSNGVNAFVAGLGTTKRYVMWDTTTDRLPDDEILFIFGHESGHYALHHVAEEVALSALGMLVLFRLYALSASWLVRRRMQAWQLRDEGAEGLATRQGMLVLLLLASLFGVLFEPAENTMSRYFEHEADVYGQEAIHGLVADPQKTTVSAFNHLGESWLEDPTPAPVVEFWLDNHPSVQHRADFAAHYDPWSAGGQGRFFAR